MKQSPPVLKALTLSLLFVFSTAATALAKDAAEIHIRTQQAPSPGTASYEAFTPQGQPRGFVEFRCYKDTKGTLRSKAITNFPTKNSQGASRTKDEVGRSLFMQTQADEMGICTPDGRPDPLAAKALLRNANNATKVTFD